MVLPGREDPVVAGGSELIGGPAGSHLRVEGRWWSPLRVALLVAGLVTLAFGFWQKQPCRSGGWDANSNYFHACYSDVPALYFGRGFNLDQFPYLSDSAELAAAGAQQLEYPVLTGLLMWLEAQLVPDVDAPGTAFFDINLAFATAFFLATIALTALTVRRRPWDAALLAASPAIALTMPINWDMLAVVLLSGAMFAWARRRPELAGILIGLGTAAKLYPALVLLPLLLLGWRTRKLQPVLQAVAWAAVSWVIVNLPFIVANREGWWTFYEFSQERGLGFSSIWYVLDLQGLGVGNLNVVASALTLLLFAGIAALTLLAPRRPRLASLCLLVVAAFLLTNKVYSPQYLLWLAPFAVLARPRWRDYWIWQGSQLVHFVGVWLYLGGLSVPNRGLGADGYTWTVVAHVAGTLWLCGVVVRDILHPRFDPVRADGVEDDPTGGVFDGAPDAGDREPAHAKPAVGEPAPSRAT